MTAAPGGPRRNADVDQDAIVRRHVHMGWSVNRLAGHYHVSPATVTAILASRQVPPAARGQLDDDAVLAAYATHGSARFVAWMMGAGEPAIQQVLDRHGVPRPSGGPGPAPISRRPSPAASRKEPPGA